MRNEGFVKIDSSRFGPLAFLSRKQWWYFEGLDPNQGLYFVFLALQAFPTDYVSLKVIDYHTNRRWTKDYLGSFQSAPAMWWTCQKATVDKCASRVSADEGGRSKWTARS
jgi:hypothetical protein